MVMFNIKCLITFALLIVQFGEGLENNTANSGQNVMGNSIDTGNDALDKGMQDIYKLYQNFLQTVMSENFYTSSASFSVDNLIDIIDKSNYEQLRTDWQKLAKTFGGFSACIIVGLLFMVVMPLVGCIYCCCHCCCHKCGGTNKRMDPVRTPCKRWTYTVILLICVTLMLVGGVIIFLGGNIFRKSLVNENNQGVVGKMDSNVLALKTFVETTIKDVQQTGKKRMIDDGLTEILKAVTDAANETVERVKQQVNATSLLEEAGNLGNDAVAAKNSLQDLNITLINLIELQNNISMVINKTIANLKQMNISITILPLSPNFKDLDMLSNETKNIVSAQNITQLVKDAKHQFDDVSSKVNQKVKDSIGNSKTKIDDITKTVQDALDKLNGTTKSFTDGLAKFRNDSVNNDNLKNTLKMVGDYTWYACIGLGSAVLLVVFFYYIAVVFGLCGVRASKNAQCCNKGNGANLLCAGILFSFLFAFILMLVLIVLFVLGGLSYTMACRYLIGGVEGVSTFENVITRGFKLNLSNTLNVSDLQLSKMLSNCKANQSIYNALHLQSIFNIDEKFNTTEVTQKVNEMINQNITDVGNIHLLSAELSSQLKSFADSGLAAIDFTTYLNQSNMPLFADGSNLESRIAELETLSAHSSSENISATLNASAQTLRNLNNDEISRLKDERKNLSRIISSLKVQVTKTGTHVDQLIANINASQENFNSQKDVIITFGLRQVVSEIINITDSVAYSTKSIIKNETGRCRKLYDSAQGLVDAVCIVTLNPLNAIWFGLGWALFFYIPCIIFAALLGNLYRRTQKYEASGFEELSHGRNYGDNVPLTSLNDDHVSGNGLHNTGYQGPEHQRYPRASRDAYNQLNDAYSHGDQPHYRGSTNPYVAYKHERPPLYEDVMTSKQNGYGRYQQ